MLLSQSISRLLRSLIWNEKVIAPRYYREGTAPGKPQGDIKHTFETKHTLYHLHFNFHLFGINSKFSPCYICLIDLTVSDKQGR